MPEGRRLSAPQQKHAAAAAEQQLPLNGATLEGQFSAASNQIKSMRRSISPGGSVRGEHANLTGLVLGCIEAKVC